MARPTSIYTERGANHLQVVRAPLQGRTTVAPVGHHHAVRQRPPIVQRVTPTGAAGRSTHSTLVHAFARQPYMQERGCWREAKNGCESAAHPPVKCPALGTNARHCPPKQHRLQSTCIYTQSEPPILDTTYRSADIVLRCANRVRIRSQVAHIHVCAKHR